MINTLRRIDRKLSDEDAKTVLRDSEYGFLSTINEDGTPHCVPIAYALYNGALYFHSAKYGYKMDAMARDARVCMTVIGQTHVINEKFTAAFESVVIEGHASLVEDPEQRMHLAREMIRRWTGGFDEAGQAMIDKTIARTAMVCVQVDAMTGKAYRG